MARFGVNKSVAWRTRNRQVIMQAQITNVAIAHAPAAEPLFGRIWAPAMVALGVGLTAAWACFLEYLFIKLIGAAI